MKGYNEQHIRNSEIAQLILLYNLYSQPASRELFFQGGTAIRWCYGGSRFSEDLDFVTHLSAEHLQGLIDKAVKAAERQMVPHFGPGAFERVDKVSRSSAVKLFVTYRPLARREKISVKLEFELLAKGLRPATGNLVLSSLPSVAYLITTGDFKIPRPSAVLVTETREEILSDKVRALLERQYLKGRDIFDLWHLRKVLHVAADKELIERKFAMYAAPFTVARGISFFREPSTEARAAIREAIEHDLSRFLPPEVMAVHREGGFREFFDVLRELAIELDALGVVVP